MSSFSNSLRKYHTEKEKEQIEMDCLLKNLPVLNDYFHLHSKIGQGTFSTVYLATLKNGSSSQKYAVKHLTQTCGQSRIQNELMCLQEIGGKDNVVPAELCLTNGKDCVTFIMPYLAHRQFSDYVIDMDAEETRFYMKNLFIALRRVHSFNIIHRDVKPNNFLYNRETKQFFLVDFGLAHLVKSPNGDKVRESSGLNENEPIDYSKKRKRSLGSSDDDKTTSFKGNKRIALKSKDSNIKISPVAKVPDEIKSEAEKSLIAGKNGFDSPSKQILGKPDVNEIPVKPKIFNSNALSSIGRRKLVDFHNASTSSKPFNTFKNQTKSKKITENSIKEWKCNAFTPLVASKSSNGNFLQIKNSKVMKQQAIPLTLRSTASLKGMPATPSASSDSQVCPCSGKGAVCAACSARQPMFAPRAGTSGFRPPEVLFKYLHQTTAVDMWAAGVVMLCILSGCYPFFNSATDLASLAEIMTIFGTERTIDVAKKFGRKILCSEYRKEIDLKKLCKRLRNRPYRKSKSKKNNGGEPKCRDCFQTIREDGCICLSSETSNESDASSRFPDEAYDLLYRLLDLDPTTRITAAEALDHPFITGES